MLFLHKFKKTCCIFKTLRGKFKNQIIRFDFSFLNVLYMCLCMCTAFSPEAQRESQVLQCWTHRGSREAGLVAYVLGFWILSSWSP